jgi:hypothetical protein
MDSELVPGTRNGTSNDTTIPITDCEVDSLILTLKVGIVIHIREVLVIHFISHVFAILLQYFAVTSPLFQS